MICSRGRKKEGRQNEIVEITTKVARSLKLSRGNDLQDMDDNLPDFWPKDIRYKKEIKKRGRILVKKERIFLPNFTAFSFLANILPFLSFLERQCNNIGRREKANHIGIRYFIMFVWSLSFLVASPLLAYRKTNVFKVRRQTKSPNL